MKSNQNLLRFVTAFATMAVFVVQGQPDFDFGDMKKNCPKFKCSGDYTPVPKSRTKFESTGCSAMGGGAMVMTAGQSDDKVYESCCHQWHACYQVCGVSKTMCDSNFQKCASDKCDETEDSEDCKKDLQMAKIMMDLGGCGAIDQKQYQSCECVAKDKAPEKREAAIRNFYKKHSPENVEKAKSLAQKADTSTKMAGLFIKLLGKYPDAIAIKEDPTKAMYEKMMKDAKEKTDEEDADNNDADSEDENIEL